jgi:ferrous iron transport protein A
MSGPVQREGAMRLPLSQLRVGDTARVAGYADDSGYAAQLMRLGLIPGTSLEVRRVAPLGDPIEIRFRGFSLALRPREAACLMLDRT